MLSRWKKNGYWISDNAAVREATRIRACRVSCYHELGVLACDLLRETPQRRLNPTYIYLRVKLSIRDNGYLHLSFEIIFEIIAFICSSFWRGIALRLSAFVKNLVALATSFIFPKSFSNSIIFLQKFVVSKQDSTWSIFTII